MARRIATGIDIGTSQIKVVVVEEIRDKRERFLRVLGTGLAESRGLRQGYVVNKEEVTEAIREAKRQAEAASRVPIRSAFLAVGGISIDEARATGETIIGRADQVVSSIDIEKAGAAAHEAATPHFLNRRVLHDIPLEYRLDGAKVMGNPSGMKGVRLEVDYLFVSVLTQHLETLIHAVEGTEVEVIDQMAATLAGANVLLTKDQQRRGCLLANLGAETTSIVVFDEGVPVSIKVIPMGSADITNDIALGLRISLDEAERVKTGRLTGAMYPRKKVDALIERRLEDICEVVEKHLKSLNRRGPLPAGVIIAGGGAAQSAITDIVRSALKLPARLAEFRLTNDPKLRDATWAVAYGLALWGLTGETESHKNSWPSEVVRSATQFFKQFLP